MAPDKAAGKARIVILGGGFGGAYCAAALDRALKHLDAEVLLIDRNNYFIYYPLLIEAGTGGLEPRHTVVSLRRFAKRARFLVAEVTEIDLERQCVNFTMDQGRLSQSVEYDHLVIALGSVSRLPPVPGLDKHGFTMKTLGDATALRNRALRMLELANATSDTQRRRALLRFVVVGANFTGVEVAGEFHQYLREAARRYPNVQPGDCQVILVEMLDRILTALPEELGVYATQKLKKRGVEILLKETVNTIEAESVTVESGRVIDTRTVIWCAGIAPPPIVERLGLPTDDRGYIRCGEDLRVEGHERVWAIGDAAANPAPDGQAYPPTAQHATRQGAHLARNLRRVVKGESCEACRIVTRGAVASLGGRSGVARVFGVKLSGVPAWFLYRTLYLFKMPGWGRRFRIALDWTINVFFGRDYVELDLRRSHETH